MLKILFERNDRVTQPKSGEVTLMPVTWRLQTQAEIFLMTVFSNAIEG